MIVQNFIVLSVKFTIRIAKNLIQIFNEIFRTKNVSSCTPSLAPCGTVEFCRVLQLVFRLHMLALPGHYRNISEVSVVPVVPVFLSFEPKMLAACPVRKQSFSFILMSQGI